MINKDIKDITLTDLLELQKQLDEDVSKPRENGFVPRKRTLLDIKLALDDEFQEWLRELPVEYNFKTWKEKEYNRENELIELVDVFFFILAYINTTENHLTKELFKRSYESYFQVGGFYNNYSLKKLVYKFKNNIWSCGHFVENRINHLMIDIMQNYLSIVILRGFTKEDIIRTYLNKWQKNMQRIKGDWTK